MGYLLPPPLAGLPEEPDSLLNTPDAGRRGLVSAATSLPGQDKSVTLCLTPLPGLPSPSPSPSITPNLLWPHSWLCSLPGIIYHCKVNRETSLSLRDNALPEEFMQSFAKLGRSRGLAS